MSQLGDGDLMKSILVGSLTVFLSVVSANSAFCQKPVQAIILSVNGRTLDSTQAQQSFNQNTGTLTDPKFAVGELVPDELFSSDGSESAIASASASAGNKHLSVKVDAQATTGAGPPAFGGANAVAGAEAQADYEDKLHFDNVGAPGSFFYVY